MRVYDTMVPPIDDDDDIQPMLGISVAIQIGMIGYHLVFG
jgi:hypothetical protein